MHLASYHIRGRTSFGIVSGDGMVDLRLRLAPRYQTALEVLADGALDRVRDTIAGVRADYPLSEVEFLPPVPGGEKIVCVDAGAEGANAEAKHPSLFFKPPTALVGHNRPLLRPRESEQLECEGAIALVIGKTCRRVAKENALDHVAGVTLCNDGTIRDWLGHGGSNITQGKSWDATGSIGPWMTIGLDLASPLRLVSRINDEVLQDGTSASMMVPFAELLAYVSTFMTLKPGDIVVTGAPAKRAATQECATPEQPEASSGLDALEAAAAPGSKTDGETGGARRWLKPGDVFEVTVEGIGTLRNAVAAEE